MNDQLRYFLELDKERTPTLSGIECIIDRDDTEGSKHHVALISWTTTLQAWMLLRIMVGLRYDIEYWLSEELKKGYEGTPQLVFTQTPEFKFHNKDGYTNKSGHWEARTKIKFINKDK